MRLNWRPFVANSIKIVSEHPKINRNQIISKCLEITKPHTVALSSYLNALLTWQTQ